jgi:hypothetical protein
VMQQIPWLIGWISIWYIWYIYIPSGYLT